MSPRPDPSGEPRSEPLSLDDAERLADTMFALSTPSRLQILDCLRAGPLSVSEIVELVGMEQSAVSHQLRVLRDHDVLSVERHGRQRLYALRTEAIAEVLHRAESHLATLRSGDPPPRRAEAQRGRIAS